jgi:adenine/guanine phosphoribosyltransferase-like PRPP-binding protein
LEFAASIPLALPFRLMESTTPSYGFEGWSTFQQKVENAVQSGECRAGSVIVVDPALQAADLFFVGRFLSLESMLRRSQVKLRLAAESPAAQRFDALHLGAFCAPRADATDGGAPSAPGVNGGAEREPAPDRTWTCILPVPPIDPHALGEGDCAVRTSRVLENVSDQMVSRLRELGVNVDAAGIELTQALSGIVREFVCNAIQHSGSSELVLAAALQEPQGAGTRDRRGSREYESRQRRMEFLVADFGQGLLRTVPEVREAVPGEVLEAYCSPGPWNVAWDALKHQEGHILSNLFLGSSLLRRGRAGEGFFEAGRRLAWFGGRLQLVTGRSEVRVLGEGGSSVVVRQRRNMRRYLPGLCVNVSLPLRLPSAPRRSAHRPVAAAAAPQAIPAPPPQPGSPENGGEPAAPACRVQPFGFLPPFIFTPLSDSESRRHSEYGAHWLLQELRRAHAGDAGHTFHYLDLKFSSTLNVPFLDHLIQELARLSIDPRAERPRVFERIFFVNVPRDVIHGLRSRSCAGTLMLHGQYCLLLDEASEPHLIGVQRIHQGLSGPEECLEHLYREGSASRAELRAVLRAHPRALTVLDDLLGEETSGMFYRSGSGTAARYAAWPVRGALEAARARHLKHLPGFRVAPGAGIKSPSADDGAEGRLARVAIKLRNGACVDSIVDFCLVWSQDDVLLDCAMLFLSRRGIPVAGTLIAFMNNGDRLAAAIQRVTRVPRLLVQAPGFAAGAVPSDVHGDLVVVVDALYPGDEERGYVHDFVDRIGKGRQARVAAVYAFQDYRDPPPSEGEESAPAERPFLGVPVRSVPAASFPDHPRRVRPDSRWRVVENHEFYLLSKPRPHLDEGERPPAVEQYSEHDRVWQSYQPNEYSLGFWRDVAQTRLLSLQPNDKRHLTFYQSTPRLMQDERLRRVAMEYVAGVVREHLHGPVDIILHPSHPVASFVAQMVAMHLDRVPLTLPLARGPTGEQVVLTPPDYDYYRSRITERRRWMRRDRLHCLVVDDSAVSGASLLTMLGIAANLDVTTRDVLVLVNRLPAEFTAAIDGAGIQVHALYRLHMPLGSWEAAPSRLLEELEAGVRREAVSSFALRRSEQPFATGWELARFCRGDPEARGLALAQGGRGAPNPHAERVLRELVLRPGAQLDLETRIAVLYNFLQPLVLADYFWACMDALLDRALDEPGDTHGVRLLRTSLFLVTHSRYVEVFRTYQRLERLCTRVVSLAVARGAWAPLAELVSEALLHLSVIGSARLLEVGRGVLTELAPRMLEDRGEAPPGHGAVRTLLGAFAWGINRLFAAKGDVLTDHDPYTETIRDLVGARPPEERAELCILLLDLLEPMVRPGTALAQVLCARRWDDQDAFLRDLAADGGNALMKYLREAPGYTCTLSTLLALCRADTVLLFARSGDDDDYVLRMFYTRRNHRGENTLTAEHLRMDGLPPRLVSRMRNSLFYHADGEREAGFLNRYRLHSRHGWALGGPVAPATHRPPAADGPAPERRWAGVGYYVVVGCCEPRDRETQCTAYTYWLRAERLLRDVLPAIHARYVESGTAWSVALQSLSPLHNIRTDVSASPELNWRRYLLKLALHRRDTGEMLRRAVRMSAEPLFMTDKLADLVTALCVEMRTGVEDVLRGPYPPRVVPPDAFTGSWPLTDTSAERLAAGPPGCRWVGGLDGDGPTYCSLHVAVLEFIALESLINAFTYCNKEVHITLGVEPAPERTANGELARAGGRATVVLTLRNDAHHEAPPPPQAATGRSACDTAASAVGGEFRSAPDPEKHGWWKTEARIPAYLVPPELRNPLHDILPYS